MTRDLYPGDIVHVEPPDGSLATCVVVMLTGPRTAITFRPDKAPAPIALNLALAIERGILHRPADCGEIGIGEIRP